MGEEINQALLDTLLETHCDFNNLINEMKEKDIIFPYEDVISLEDASYHISYNAISRMNKSLQEYNFCTQANEDFFAGEKKIYLKYIMLYIISIIMIKVFSKTLSTAKINEIWYALVGLVLGTVNANIVNKNVHEYRYGKKENRELLNNVKSLEEDYDNDFEIAQREISYMQSLNRNLIEELHRKVLIKK